MNGAISRATALITGNSGGYVVLHDSNNDGKPDELLIMNTEDIATATKVWRWNLSGLGYSNTGYDGNYGLAMTMEGEIDCSFLRTGTLVFGGTVGNTDGSLTIKDQNNNVIANFNKSGCTVKGNIYADSFVAKAGDYCEMQIGTYSGANADGLFVVNDVVTPPSGWDEVLPLAQIGYQGSGNNGGGQLILRSANGGHQTFLLYSDNNNPYIHIIESAHSYGDEDYNIHWDPNSNLKSIELGCIVVDNGALRGRTNSPIKSLQLSDGSNSRIYINSTLGQLLMGFSGSDSIKLEAMSGQITCVSLVQTSSKRYKENIEELTEDEAKKLLLLVPVKYDFKNSPVKDKCGFIAEEVEEIIPGVVTKNNNNEAEGISYTEIIPYLTKMIQIQQKQINDLQKRVDELERSK